MHPRRLRRKNLPNPVVAEVRDTRVQLGGGRGRGGGGSPGAATSGGAAQRRRVGAGDIPPL
jgi:hypothetical protein